MRVDDVMKPAKCCREDDTVRACAQLMKQENVGFVPICNQASEPTGAVTDRDLVIRGLAEGCSSDDRLSDLMTREIVSCRTGADLREAEQLMRDHRKSRVMICDESGKLAGVISLSDVAELESEETAGQTLRDIASRESRQPHAS